MDMSDEKKPFTVRDRRHFTPEGGTRVEAAEPVRPGSQAATATAEAPSSAAPKPEPPVDFSSFIVSLAAQAGMLIEAEDPDLQGARSFISIFEMLRDKTEGRRTPDEDRILEQILYELRMAYLARATVAEA